MVVAGALDPQQASSSSEELKAALLQQGMLHALAELAADCSARLAAAPKGDTLRYIIKTVQPPFYMLGIAVLEAGYAGGFDRTCICERDHSACMWDALVMSNAKPSVPFCQAY